MDISKKRRGSRCSTPLRLLDKRISNVVSSLMTKELAENDAGPFPTAKATR